MNRGLGVVVGSVIENTLKGMRVGKPRLMKGMAVVPLKGNKRAKIGYTLIDRAIEKGDVLVTEIGEGGNVPQLKLNNKSTGYVLINDGTQLVGAKQNRIVNATILVAPGMEIMIPVSCVEAGRWAYRERVFRGGRHHSPHRMRKEYVTAQHHSPKSGMWYVADQGKVWGEVDAMSSRLDARSPTRSMEEVFDQRKNSFDEYLDALAPGKTDTGFAVFIRGQFCGLDLFDSPGTLSSIHRKLLTGYVADAVAAEDDGEAASLDELNKRVTEILEEVQKAGVEGYPAAAGIGLDERYEGGLSIGKGLSFEGDLIHFSAFAR